MGLRRRTDLRYCQRLFTMLSEAQLLDLCGWLIMKVDFWTPTIFSILSLQTPGWRRRPRGSWGCTRTCCRRCACSGGPQWTRCSVCTSRETQCLCCLSLCLEMNLTSWRWWDTFRVRTRPGGNISRREWRRSGRGWNSVKKVSNIPEHKSALRFNTNIHSEAKSWNSFRKCYST